MNIELTPENTGLVIVDMQAEGCERHGATLKPVIKNIRNLLDRCRAANGKIIHIQSVRGKDHPEFTVFGKEYSLLDGTQAVEFVEELKPLPGEIVIKKFSDDFTKPRSKTRSKSCSFARAGTELSSPASARTTAFIMP